MGNIEDLIGKKVRDRRLKMGLSQSDLAKNAKTSLTTINRLEKGRQLPQSSTLKEIARALGVTESELLGGPMAHQNETPAPSGRSDLILAIQARLTALDERELRLILGFLDDLDSHRTVETSPTVRAK